MHIRYNETNDLYEYLVSTGPEVWATLPINIAQIVGTIPQSQINTGLTESFRGLHLRTHPDFDVASSKIQLLKADQIVMSDGERINSWDNLVADITASGAGGLDTGSEGASIWYGIYAIAKDDGTKNLLLHREKDYFKDQQQLTNTAAAEGFRSSSTYTKKAQSFQVATAGTIPFIDLLGVRNGSPTGRIWITLEADSAGRPSGTPLATSDKLDIASFTTAAGQWIRFIFRSPVTFNVSTTYHLVLQGDFTISASNFYYWYGNTAGGYANGKAQKYNGTTWSDQATDTDQVFKIYVTRNDTSLTLPSGYTKSCKIGYVYNNSSSNFYTFVATDRRVHPILKSGGINDWGNSTITYPTLVDLSTLIPPTPVVMINAGLSTVAGTAIVIGGVPDAFGQTVNIGDYGQTFMHGPASNYAITLPDIQTEMQGAYVYQAGPAATIHAYLMAWTWLR